MNEEIGGARPACDRPAADPTVSRRDEALTRAAARVLARHLHPLWRPADDGQLDAWGHGYGAGVRDKHAQDRDNCATPPGGGA